MTADTAKEISHRMRADPAATARRWLRGVSVAFIGADGAGKTTIIEGLLDVWPEIARYVYMGASVDRANYSLPTSRWWTRRKRRLLAKTLDDPDVLPPAVLLTEEQRDKLPGGRLVKAIGLANRVSEEWYRQLVVTIFKLRGFIVLCDRHYLFDYCPHRDVSDASLSVRLHHWFLRRLYPQPDLSVFLDARPEVLLQRKPEWPIQHLERQRENIVEEGRHLRNFVRVDAAQPADAVLADVGEYVIGLLRGAR